MKTAGPMAHRDSTIVGLWLEWNSELCFVCEFVCIGYVTFLSAVRPNKSYLMFGNNIYKCHKLLLLVLEYTVSPNDEKNWDSQY